MLRVNRGMSQAMLAERIGVTFQQMQKYERGATRVGASRLSRVASVLGVSVGALFESSQAESPGLNSSKLFESIASRTPGVEATVALFNTVDLGERRKFPSRG
jgi:transcriptional regulator with XRE-family HTH domain